MTHQIPEELISAYLDGELTSDEQLLVEEALRDDPQSQQLLEDLQSLHDRLQAIPRSEPSRDYTEQILRRAERAILTGTTEPGPSVSSDESSAAPTVTLPTGKDSPGNWKHVIWASTALAATLLLALLFRPDKPISNQLTDATQPQADQIAPAEHPKLTSADVDKDDTSRLENQLPADAATESEEGTEGTAAGLATKFAPGESVQPKNRPAASFGDTAPASNDLGPSADTSNPEELFLYVNLTQKDFDRQTVVRTLLHQQVPFGYDPASQDGLPAITAGRTKRALLSELDQVAEADEEKLKHLAARKRDQINAREKGSASLAREAPARTLSNTRVVTIEASPEELEELVLNLSNQYQVELAVENNGIGQQFAPNRQLASPVNRQAVERIQALATENNRRRTAANITPAGKAAAKTAEPDDAKDSKPAPTTIRAPANSANKKQARQANPGSTNKFYQARRQQKPGTLRVVVVIEADPPLAAAATPARKTSLKGWELYVWQQDGTTYFSLMVGNNRLKTAEEIAKSAVKGVEAIQPQLDQLQKGELVFVHGRRLGTKAPASPAKQVTEYCEKIGLKTQ
jgi:hypothetical protein